jgi:hypothetical protein
VSAADDFMEAIAQRVAAIVLAKLSASRAPERVVLADVSKHGAPSARWIQDRAREGKITLHGPRGARFVLAMDLHELLASTTIRRVRSTPALPNSTANFDDDASAAVIDLMARRRAS